MEKNKNTFYEKKLKSIFITELTDSKIGKKHDYNFFQLICFFRKGFEQGPGAPARRVHHPLHW
jgi:hypothetical protein